MLRWLFLLIFSSSLIVSNAQFYPNTYIYNSCKEIAVNATSSLDPFLNPSMPQNSSNDPIYFFDEFCSYEISKSKLNPDIVVISLPLPVTVCFLYVQDDVLLSTEAFQGCNQIYNPQLDLNPIFLTEITVVIDDNSYGRNESWYKERIRLYPTGSYEITLINVPFLGGTFTNVSSSLMFGGYSMSGVTSLDLVLSRRIPLVDERTSTTSVNSSSGTTNQQESVFDFSKFTGLESLKISSQECLGGHGDQHEENENEQIINPEQNLFPELSTRNFNSNSNLIISNSSSTATTLLVRVDSSAIEEIALNLQCASLSSLSIKNGHNLYGVFLTFANLAEFFKSSITNPNLSTGLDFASDLRSGFEKSLGRYFNTSLIRTSFIVDLVFSSLADYEANLKSIPGDFFSFNTHQPKSNPVTFTIHVLNRSSPQSATSAASPATPQKWRFGLPSYANIFFHFVEVDAQLIRNLKSKHVKYLQLVDFVWNVSATSGTFSRSSQSRPNLDLRLNSMSSIRLANPIAVPVHVIDLSQITGWGLTSVQLDCTPFYRNTTTSFNLIKLGDLQNVTSFIYNDCELMNPSESLWTLNMTRVRYLQISHVMFSPTALDFLFPCRNESSQESIETCCRNQSKSHLSYLRLNHIAHRQDDLELTPQMFCSMPELVDFEITHSRVRAVSQELLDWFSLPTSGIQSVNMSGNLIESLPPLHLANKASLIIDLSHNRLKSIDQICANQSAQLKLLNVNHNNLGAFNASLMGCGFSQRSELNLNNNQISDFYMEKPFCILPDQTSQCVLTINAAFNNLTSFRFLPRQRDPIPRSRSGEVKVARLLVDLSYNQISHLPSNAFHNISYLFHLDLSYNNLSDPNLIHPGWMNLSCANRGCFLNLAGNRLQHVNWGNLFIDTTLNFLNLSDNQISQFPTTLTQIPVNVPLLLGPLDNPVTQSRAQYFYLEINLRQNQIKRLVSPLCTQTPSDWGKAIYFDIAYNLINLLTVSAISCPYAKSRHVLLNLNSNPISCIPSPPTAKDPNSNNNSIALLSLMNTKLTSLPCSLGESYPRLKSVIFSTSSDVDLKDPSALNSSSSSSSPANCCAFITLWEKDVGLNAAIDPDTLNILNPYGFNLLKVINLSRQRPSVPCTYTTTTTNALSGQSETRTIVTDTNAFARLRNLSDTETCKSYCETNRCLFEVSVTAPFSYAMLVFIVISFPLLYAIAFMFATVWSRRITAPLLTSSAGRDSATSSALVQRLVKTSLIPRSSSSTQTRSREGGGGDAYAGSDSHVYDDEEITSATHPAAVHLRSDDVVDEGHYERMIRPVFSGTSSYLAPAAQVAEGSSGRLVKSQHSQQELRKRNNQSVRALALKISQADYMTDVDQDHTSSGYSTGSGGDEYYVCGNSSSINNKGTYMVRVKSKHGGADDSAYVAF